MKVRLKLEKVFYQNHLSNHYYQPGQEFTYERK